MLHVERTKRALLQMQKATATIQTSVPGRRKTDQYQRAFFINIRTDNLTCREVTRLWKSNRKSSQLLLPRLIPLLLGRSLERKLKADARKSYLGLA